MPQEGSDLPIDVPPTKPTEAAEQDASSDSSAIPQPDDPQEADRSAKPRRMGYRAEIVGLQEAQTVSLRKAPTRPIKIVQGDILRNVDFVEDVFEDKAGTLHVPQIRFPTVIVLTQACDLDNAESLLSVLVAPLYNAEHVFAGNHLVGLDRQVPPINKGKTDGRRVEQNKNPRYHFLRFPEGVQLPDSIIDFRHYFSVNIEYLRSLRDSKVAWTVPPLWRDDVSQRFAAFLARIGLPQPVPPPDNKEIEEALRWPK